tara:strand:+ start:107 stop:628 length:522 start_codon:yes stop_codon:yes gene_type:complete
MTRPVQLGTVIEGTLLNDDLLEAFSGELDAIRTDSRAHYTLALDALNRWYRNDGTDNEYGSNEDDIPDLINELIDAINEYRLPYTYFGTNYGDGANFGWWIDFDNLNESVRESESITQDLRSSDRLSDEESWIQECDCQENDCIGKHGFIVHVNDHGNVTLLDHNRKDVWAVV